VVRSEILQLHDLGTTPGVIEVDYFKDRRSIRMPSEAVQSISPIRPTRGKELPVWGSVFGAGSGLAAAARAFGVAASRVGGGGGGVGGAATSIRRTPTYTTGVGGGGGGGGGAAAGAAPVVCRVWATTFSVASDTTVAAIFIPFFSSNAVYVFPSMTNF